MYNCVLLDSFSKTEKKFNQANCDMNQQSKQDKSATQNLNSSLNEGIGSINQIKGWSKDVKGGSGEEEAVF